MNSLVPIWILSSNFHLDSLCISGFSHHLHLSRSSLHLASDRGHHPRSGRIVVFTSSPSISDRVGRAPSIGSSRSIRIGSHHRFMASEVDRVGRSRTFHSGRFSSSLPWSVSIAPWSVEHFTIPGRSYFTIPGWSVFHHLMGSVEHRIVVGLAQPGRSP